MGRIQKTVENNIQDYRNLDLLSYSALKKYVEDRKKFKLLFVDKDEDAILKDKEEKSKSDYIRMGNIVDVILTDNDNFHQYFVETKANKPSGQLLTLTDFLFSYTINDTKDGVVQSSFEDRFEKAYEDLKQSNGGKVRDKLETFLTNFNIGAIDFFDEKIRSYGKTIITTDERVMAESICHNLKNSEGTAEIVRAEGITKFPIIFNVGDTPMKMEADKIIFDHNSKTIYPYDYKITSFVESFVWESFLKKSYYIQSGLYKFGIEQWKNSNEYKDYKVENLAFIVADQNNYYSPLLYKTQDLHYYQSWNGFKVGNKTYKGIIQILEDIKVSIDENKWGMSPQNIRSKGQLFIPLFTNLEE